jgi:hypothetical protein
MTRKLVLLVSIGALAFGAGVPSAMATSSTARSKGRANVISSHSVSGSPKTAISKKKVLPTAVVPPNTTNSK